MLILAVVLVGRGETILLSKSGHQESDGYNHFWRCSNSKETPTFLIKRKLNILELGATLGSISEACRKLGVSRRHYYDIKSAIEEEGLEGLLGLLTGWRLKLNGRFWTIPFYDAQSCGFSPTEEPNTVAG